MTTSYRYDADNVRTARSAAANEYFVHDMAGQLLSEFEDACSGTIRLKKHYVYAGSRLLASVSGPAVPSVSFVSPASSVSEAAGNASVQVAITNPGGGLLPCPATVRVESAAGTASATQDFSPISTLLTFAAETPSGSVQTVQVPIVNDPTDEAAETFALSLSSPTNAAIAGTGHQVTITDDDPPPTVSIGDASITEGYAPVAMTFTVSLSAASSFEVRVSWSTANGTASQGQDYTATSGQLVFPPGTVSQSVVVQVLPDGIAEGQETFTVNLSGPINATLADGVGVGTIVPHPPETRIALEAPGQGATAVQPFLAAGWATDPYTSTPPGVDSLEALAYPNPGSGAPPITFPATGGISRPDVAQVYGPAGANSGYQAQVRGLAPGTYKLVTRGRNTTTLAYATSNEVTVTVAAQPLMSVDTPASGTGVNQNLLIAGWVIDLAAASGTGVDVQHVWAYPNPGSGTPPIFLGATTYGGARPDVGGYYGAQFTNSGFGLSAHLDPGVYQIIVYSFSNVSMNFSLSQSVTVTVATSSPMMSIDAPAANGTVSQPFAVAGWAVDTGAPSGTGVDYVHVYVNSQGGPGGTYLGSASFGPRQDIANWLGPQFLNSGYGLIVSGLAPGAYQLNVYAHSTVSGLWSLQSIWITVQ